MKRLFFAVLSVTAMLALTFSSVALDKVPSSSVTRTADGFHTWDSI